MRYTIREITSGWSVIDYPEYFRDLETAIYNAKEWSKGNKSMFFIIDDCDNTYTADGLMIDTKIERCRDCAYLVEGICGEWICSDWEKEIHEVSDDECLGDEPLISFVKVESEVWK